MRDPNCTPLAAVAGATADMVADFLLETGATNIVVNNGGDISIRLREGERQKLDFTSIFQSMKSIIMLSSIRIAVFVQVGLEGGVLLLESLIARLPFPTELRWLMLRPLFWSIRRMSDQLK
jgi:hypothetical protein